MTNKTISHYKILEKIGEGGMGVVYKAEDTKLKRIVALKFLPPELTRDKDAKERFIHEAQAAAVLDHTNICNVYEIDESTEGQIFIAMGYYEGETLKDRIEKGPLKIEEALKIAIQISEGLHEAHEKGIAHRDIKSANIIITDKGIAKILDFGLAKLKGQSKLTKVGATVGTATYMSPEQAKGAEVDHRTDIWSLGVVLYEMLTGQLPFKGDYEQAIVYSIINEEPEPMTGLRTGIPMELERIVNKALAKKQDERYQHVNEIIGDLKKLRKDLDSGYSEEKSKKKSAPSIAVLPFRDMSPQKDQEYFCEGMAEELINALTKVARLQVASRTSAFQFKGKGYDISEIGKKLNVQSVMEGSIRKAGNKLRITAQLVNVSDGYHLWSEKYDRDMEDIFAIQDEISLMIVEILKVKLLEKDKAKLLRRYTEDQEAYDLYLKGRYFWNRRYEGGLQKAIEYFNQTIKKDPSHAPAYSGIADSISILGLFWLPPREVFPRAKLAAQKAIEIDETLAEGHASLGWILFMYDWDWTGAEREFKRALELDPFYALNHSWYSLFLSWMGRFEEAETHNNKALELEPVSLIINSTSTQVLYACRQFDKAIKQGVRSVEMDPNFLLSYWHLAFGYIAKGMWEESIAALEKAAVLSGDSPFVLAVIGYVYARSGQKSKVQKILSRLREISKTKYNSPMNEALIFLGLEKKDKIFEYLEKAYNERSYAIPTLKVYPLYDSIRLDSRYLELLKKLG